MTDHDRRFRATDNDDLDFTWQAALRQAHARIDELFEHIHENASRITLVEHEIKDQGVLLRTIAEDLHKLTKQSDQINGGARVLVLLGTLSITIATGWDSIISFFHRVIK